MEDSLKRKGLHLTDTKEKLKKIRIHSAPNLLEKKEALNGANHPVSWGANSTHHTNDKSMQRGVKQKKVRNRLEAMEIERSSSSEASVNKGVSIRKSESSTVPKLKPSYPSVFNLARLNDKITQLEEHVEQLTHKVNQLSIHDSSPKKEKQSSDAFKRTINAFFLEEFKKSCQNLSREQIQEKMKKKLSSAKKYEKMLADEALHYSKKTQVIEKLNQLYEKVRILSSSMQVVRGDDRTERPMQSASSDKRRYDLKGKGIVKMPNADTKGLVVNPMPNADTKGLVVNPMPNADTKGKLQKKLRSETRSCHDFSI